jgi:hypothetical protein
VLGKILLQSIPTDKSAAANVDDANLPHKQKCFRPPTAKEITKIPPAYVRFQNQIIHDFSFPSPAFQAGD